MVHHDSRQCGGYCPLLRARTLGIPVEEREDLPDGVWGYWDGQRIVLDGTLPHRCVRATLAHELLHAERGDDGVALRQAQQSVLAERAMERDVDVVAARQLLPIHELGDVLALASNELDVAELMRVDVETVRVRLDTLDGPEREYLQRRLRKRIA